MCFVIVLNVSMSIQQTKDYEMIKDMFLNDTELYERISDDFTDPEKFVPENSLYLGWFEDNICKAVLMIHPENAIVLNIHMHIPKKYRGKNSLKMGLGLIEHLIETRNKRYVKINAKIPDLFPDVIRFAEKCGFQKEGTDRKSHIKNGKYYDRILYGRII